MIYSFIFGVYELVMLLTSFIFGKLVSRIAPNIMCGFGLAVTGLSTIAFGLLDHTPNGLLFIIPAFVLRITESLGATAFAISSYSFITYKFPEKTATMFSYMELCFGMGLIIAPVVGAVLYEMGGYSLPFGVLGFMLTISASIILIFLETNRINTIENLDNNNSEIVNRSDTSILKFLLNPIIILDALVIITALSLIGFNCATLEPHLRDFKLKPLMIGIIFVTIGLMYAITAPVWGKLCDIFNHNLSIFSIFGSFLCVFGLILIGPLPYLKVDKKLWLIVVSLVCFGIGTAAKQCSGYSHALNFSIKNRGLLNESSTYGLVSGMFFASISLGGFIGPTIGGFFLENYNYETATVFMLAIEVSILLSLIISFLSKKMTIK